MTMTILQAEIREELLGLLRNPIALFFSVVMPVGFFALTVGIFGGRGYSLSALGAFGAFAVILVVTMNPGIGLAEARESGWLSVKRASGTPIVLTLVAKVVAAIPYAVGVMIAMVTTAVAFGALEFDPVASALVIVALVAGSLPFALFGIAIGARLGANATTAVVNAIVFPMVIASGLWFPLEILPEGVQAVAPWLPAYHLAGLSGAAAEGTAWLTHAGVLLATLLVAAAAAVTAYRTART